MPAPPHIDLVAKLNRAHARPDYDIFAGDQRVGRVYLMHTTSKSESWWWGLNEVMVDSTIGVPIKGYTDSLPKAQFSLNVQSMAGMGASASVVGPESQAGYTRLFAGWNGREVR